LQLPKELKVGRGIHKFKVRATDPAGNVDPSPAKDRFVRRPRALTAYSR